MLISLPLTAAQARENVDKKKKKLTDFQRKVFYEASYYKGLEFYCKAMMRLSVTLAQKNLIKSDEDDERQAARFALRVNTMQNVLFMRKPEYEEFKNLRDEINSLDVSCSLLLICSITFYV